ncbi:MAG: hypothetical protein CME36_16315 [unclassified Hahellaceae]|nr:hypothetical protein [Hahellaceae bacterium]|tara:strand:+ start:107887 stop:108129 length:243 start_codon:yes stop_codon:yes gene_type:complete
MFLAFFAWYKGLALGGAAKVALVQLLQPFLTLFASALLLGEHLAPSALVTAGAVVIVVFLAQLTRLRGTAAAAVVPATKL